MTNRNKDNGGPDQPNPSVLGLALNLSTELVAALIVGLGIGYALDFWLGTSPWLKIVFFILGSIAGVLNMVRTAQKIEQRTQNNESKTEDESED